MPNIAKAYVQIIPSAQGIKGQLSSLMDKDANAAGKESGKKAGSGFMSGIKGMLVKAGIGAAIGKTITDALNAGGALEQSLGGVETLFKESAGNVIQNADAAWKTAGISANAYMEQATSFSASLLQSLGGDTEEAARIADQAIIDMADNANKFGTATESVQAAFQGFAKGQYQLLDNLKLGYGGTKTEMERLLKDATKISGVKYDINNLADVYNAIHVIQTELGVTGTTTKEAATTFQGSLASVKAAWQNVLGNMMTGRKELAYSVIALGQSAYTFVAGNLLPALGRIASSVPEVLKTVFTRFGPALSAGISQGLPMLAGKAVEIIGNLVSGLIKAAPSLIKGGAELMRALLIGISNSIPEIIEAGKQGLENAKEAFKEIDWKQVGNTAKVLMKMGFTHLKEEIAPIVEKVKTAVSEKFEEMKTNISKKMTDAKTAVTDKWNETKTSVENKLEEIKTSISNKFLEAKNKMISRLSEFPKAAAEKIEEVRTKIAEIVEKIKGIFNFEWSLPKPKIPKFSVTGGEAPWGFLGKGSLPSVSVSWNAKAMNKARILDGAEIFGAMGGKLLGGGETGREVLSGESHLIDLIKQSVSAVSSNQIAEIIRWMKEIEGTMYTKMVRALQTLGIKFDERELARLVKKYA